MTLLPERSITSAQILIIDDDASALRLLARMLQGAGYSRLRCSQDAREVLALYEDLQPDLILLDLHLSQIGGLELLTQLVDRTRGAYVPVLMLTADRSSTAVHEALAAGAKDFVRKLWHRLLGLLGRPAAGQRPSLEGYVTGTGPTDGAPAAGGC